MLHKWFLLRGSSSWFRWLMKATRSIVWRPLTCLFLCRAVPSVCIRSVPMRQILRPSSSAPIPPEQGRRTLFIPARSREKRHTETQPRASVPGASILIDPETGGTVRRGMYRSEWYENSTPSGALEVIGAVYCTFGGRFTFAKRMHTSRG